MKKLIVLFVLAVAATGSALAQSSYVFVDSEAIFKSLDDYNAAIKQLDDLSAQYQKNIDEAYATLDQMYETY